MQHFGSVSLAPFLGFQGFGFRGGLIISMQSCLLNTWMQHFGSLAPSRVSLAPFVGFRVSGWAHNSIPASWTRECNILAHMRLPEFHCCTHYAALACQATALSDPRTSKRTARKKAANHADTRKPPGDGGRGRWPVGSGGGRCGSRWLGAKRLLVWCVFAFFSGKSKAKGKSKGKSKGKAESIKELDAGYPESPRQRYFDVLIFSQSKDLWRQTSFTPDNFYYKEQKTQTQRRKKSKHRKTRTRKHQRNAITPKKQTDKRSYTRHSLWQSTQKLNAKTQPQTQKNTNAEKHKHKNTQKHNHTKNANTNTEKQTQTQNTKTQTRKQENTTTQKTQTQTQTQTQKHKRANSEKHKHANTPKHNHTKNANTQTQKNTNIQKKTQPHKVLQSATLYYKVLLQYYSLLQSTILYYSVLQSTTKYYSSTTPVLLQYYSVLQSATRCYSSPLYYKVLFQHYSVIQSTTPVLLWTPPYYLWLGALYLKCHVWRGLFMRVVFH